MKRELAAAMIVLAGMILGDARSAWGSMPVPVSASAGGAVHLVQSKPPQKGENANAAAEKQRQAEQARRNAIEKVKQAAEKAKAEAARKAKEEAARKNKEREEAARKNKEREEAARKNREKEEAARKTREKEEAARKAKDEAARQNKEREETARKNREREEAARLAKEKEEAARKAKDDLARTEKAKEDAKSGAGAPAECPRGAKRDPKNPSGPCIATPSTPSACPSGQYRDPKNPSGPCIATPSTPPACPSGQYRDPKNPSGPCIATPSTPPACPSGQYRDPRNPSGPCIATPSTPPACPSGQYRDPKNPTGPCVAERVDCAKGTARRQAGGDCEPLPGTPSCGNGQRRDYGGYCVCIATGKLPERDGRCQAVTEVPRACPNGTYRDPRNPDACIPYVTECPPGMGRRSAGSPCEWIQRAEPVPPPRPDRPCPQGTYRNRFGDCEYPREEPPRTAQPDRPRIVPLPIPLPVPGTPAALVPAGPELAGLCKGKPGAGRQDDVVRIGRKEIDTMRGAHEITYGSRQRKLVPIKDLPSAVGVREWDGQLLHADAYADLAAKPSTCKGRTDDGLELRIVDVPMQNGGTAPACIVYCRTGDTPPRPPVTSEPGRPAISTVVATPVIQPYRPAVETVYARPQTEPRRPAVPTVVASPAPQRQRPAVPTLAASPTRQPSRLAVQTVKASPATVAARPAVETVKAGSVQMPAATRR